MKVLVISYSQSGQLTSIVGNFVSSLSGEIDRIHIRPKPNFDFPWTSRRFFDAMPETVMEIPGQLEDISFKYEKYDVIILGYQPWFLSPSLPITALLAQEGFKTRLKDTPVVTLIGARNMWLNSQENIKKHIAEAGGKLVGNIPFVDRNNNFLSAVSILHWMLTGKKEKKFGIFPKPGVSDEEIAGATQFGKILEEVLQTDQLPAFQDRILSTGHIKIGTDILFIEARAKKLFKIWAKLILKKSTTPRKRRFWIGLFTYYLLVALFIIAPVVLTVYTILVRPFTLRSIKRKKAYFCNVNLES